MLNKYLGTMFLLIIPFLNVSHMLADEQIANSQVIILSQYNPPFVYANEQGNFVGTAVPKVKEIMEQAGIDYKMQSVSWKRSLANLKQYPEIMAFPVSRIPERESLFKWLVPLHSINYQLVGLKAKFNAKFSDIKNEKYSFLCSDKTVACSALKAMGVPEQSIITIARVDNQQSLDMLIRGRVDFKLFTKEEFEFFMDKLKIDKNQFVILEKYNFEVVEYLVGNLDFSESLVKRIRDTAKLKIKD